MTYYITWGHTRTRACITVKVDRLIDVELLC